MSKNQCNVIAIELTVPVGCRGLVGDFSCGLSFISDSRTLRFESPRVFEAPK